MRRVLHLIERSIDEHGQVPLVSEIIAPYADHCNHEQFHLDYKGDLDLTRLPSSKFDTNALVCQLATLAMNILRLIGRHNLLGPNAPIRHIVKRSKTAIYVLIPRAGRLIQTYRRIILGFGASDRTAQAFAREQGELIAVRTSLSHPAAQLMAPENRARRALRRG